MVGVDDEKNSTVMFASPTHLVINLLGSAWKGYILREGIAILDQLLALRPIVECAGHIDFVGGMVPMTKQVSRAICEVDGEAHKECDERE